MHFGVCCCSCSVFSRLFLPTVLQMVLVHSSLFTCFFLYRLHPLSICLLFFFCLLCLFVPCTHMACGLLYCRWVNPTTNLSPPSKTDTKRPRTHSGCLSLSLLVVCLTYRLSPRGCVTKHRLVAYRVKSVYSFNKSFIKWQTEQKWVTSLLHLSQNKPALFLFPLTASLFVTFLPKQIFM